MTRNWYPLRVVTEVGWRKVPTLRRAFYYWWICTCSIARTWWKAEQL